MGYKAYSDGYLMSLTKAEIIELLRVAEHNFFTTEEALKNSAKAGQEYAKKFDKAKELLSFAARDMTIVMTGERCDICKFEFRTCRDKCKWRYMVEVLMLIGEGDNKNV